MKPYGRWHLPVERKLTFCMDNERVRPHHGVIGKFDIEKLSEHLSETSKEPSFYALFRALISNEPTRPSVVRAVKEAKDNIDLEEVVS